MSKLSRLVYFFRTDVIWVAIGQLVTLVVGLLSLKIYTNLFSTAQYAYIALMMAMAAWVWTGVYQPLNQTILRFFPLAESEGWKDSFLPYVFSIEKKLALIVLFISGTLLSYFYSVDKEPSFLLLVSLSACMGIVYGGVHGLISFFLAQRKRREVAFLQSTDSLLRLSGGVIAFYYFSNTEYATATGIVFGGVLYFLLAILIFRKSLAFKSNTSQLKDLTNKLEGFNRYFKKMVLIMLLNASVINLDKWLLFYLIGGDGFGKYAAIYVLAIAMTSILYLFFEMLGFPLIFKQTVPAYRQKILDLLLLFYILSLTIIVLLVDNFGEILLLFLTTPNIATEKETFTLLVLACGFLNLGRLLMVQGLAQKEPGKYWSAYLILLITFVSWCLLFVRSGESYIAAKGFELGAVCFVITIIFVNGGINNEIRDN